MIKNILIALSTDDELLPSLYAWGRRFDWENVEEVHFLHIVKKNITPLEFGLMETPDEEAFEEMRPALYRFLHQEALKIIPSEFRPKVSFHLLTNFYPDEETAELSKAIKADLLVVATHGKHSFFRRSFTEHVVETSPCDVYVIRPETPEVRAP